MYVMSTANCCELAEYLKAATFKVSSRVFNLQAQCLDRWPLFKFGHNNRYGSSRVKSSIVLDVDIKVPEMLV